MEEEIWKEIPNTKGLYFMNEQGKLKGPNNKIRLLNKGYYLQTGLDSKMYIYTRTTLSQLFNTNLEVKETELHKKRRLFMEHLFYLCNKDFHELSYEFNDEKYYVILVDQERQTCIGINERFGIMEKWLFNTEFDVVEKKTRKNIIKSKLKICFSIINIW